MPRSHRGKVKQDLAQLERHLEKLQRRIDRLFNEANDTEGLIITLKKAMKKEEAPAASVEA